MTNTIDGATGAAPEPRLEAVPFALVLAGGGARGYAHVGVLRALQERGLHPAALVGVSMGAVVSATYAAREDWYDALMTVDTSGFPHPLHDGGGEEPQLLRRAVGYVHTAWNMVTGWGAPPSAVEAGREVLDFLLGSVPLGEGRIPVALSATDLITGRRVIVRTGNAVDAVYASAALAGVLPPLPMNGGLLADGAYSDIAPIDVGRAFGLPAVIVVDPSQASSPVGPRNGLESVMRAMEICHLRHAELRMREADLVIRPAFGRTVNILDFDSRVECVAAGERAVVDQWGLIAGLLRVPES